MTYMTRGLPPPKVSTGATTLSSMQPLPPWEREEEREGEREGEEEGGGPRREGVRKSSKGRAMAVYSRFSSLERSLASLI